MLIIGAKGLAKEVLEIFNQKKELDNLFFYDDISTDLPEKLYGQFTILRSMQQLVELFKEDNKFTIGVGKPAVRKKMHDLFISSGGKLVSAISPFAQIGHYGTTISDGCIIMAGSVITNDVNIGMGCLINPNCTISHDSQVGNFVEISPGVQITGHCIVGDYCTIGTGAIILPKVKLGDHVIVGAGAVVKSNVSAGETVVGVPAKALNKK